MTSNGGITIDSGAASVLDAGEYIDASEISKAAVDVAHALFTDARAAFTWKGNFALLYPATVCATFLISSIGTVAIPLCFAAIGVVATDAFFYCWRLAPGPTVGVTTTTHRRCSTRRGTATSRCDLALCSTLVGFSYTNRIPSCIAAIGVARADALFYSRINATLIVVWLTALTPRW